MRILSLFSGAGGADLGLETAGHTIAALCEIEQHARAVLRHHWPDVPLHGDVSTLDGTAYRGHVDLVVGGSPCQDLSIAGKRAGMTEGSGTRSSLYFEQVRIWQETEAPYLIWENVLGALSSNAGRDFAAVLSALVGAPLAVPDDGWRGAGVASGPTGVAAWRVLDAQFFGVPQRRRRVFVLCARAGGRDPAEVLALSEGVPGHPAARREAGKGVAADAGGGTTGTLTGNGDGHTGFRDADGLVVASDQVLFSKVQYGAYEDAPSVASTLGARDHASQNTDIVLSWDDECNPTGDVMGTLPARTESGSGRGGVVRAGIPRRLMPIETERLMGWPSGHTALGIDERGRAYTLSDTARYRLCGNGIAAPCAAWLGFRLASTIKELDRG